MHVRNIYIFTGRICVRARRCCVQASLLRIIIRGSALEVRALRLAGSARCGVRVCCSGLIDYTYVHVLTFVFVVSVSLWPFACLFLSGSPLFIDIFSSSCAYLFLLVSSLVLSCSTFFFFLASFQFIRPTILIGRLVSLPCLASDLLPARYRTVARVPPVRNCKDRVSTVQ
jgi:hypothetical protein